MNNETRPLGHNRWLKDDGLALKDRVACDAGGCDRDAVYYIQLGCCGAVSINCEPCMARLFQLLTWMIRVDEQVICHECGEKNNPRGWVTKPELLVDTPDNGVVD